MSENKKDEVNNFIKSSDKVFLLLNQESINISHTKPFKNSHSGTLKFAIVAKSPIFIRNHFVGGDESYVNPKTNETISKEFCHYNNVQYIPATSVKGMIRNLLEILTYSKLGGKISKEYNNKVASTPCHNSAKFDLSEAIFGTTELKGRVSFSHFKIVGEAKYFRKDAITTVLMTPEAKKDKFGWKVYPVLNKVDPSDKEVKENVKSEFRPLKQGTEFEGVLRYHNLRDFELGALLSALSFHNSADLYHLLGLGKSLGFGKVNIKFYEEIDEVALKAFEDKMNAELFEGKIEWHKSHYIKELLKKQQGNLLDFESYSDSKNVQSLYKEYLERKKIDDEIENKKNVEQIKREEAERLDQEEEQKRILEEQEREEWRLAEELERKLKEEEAKKQQAKKSAQKAQAKKQSLNNSLLSKVGKSKKKR